MTTFSKLSEQMVVQILSRLPPKSLIRFKCVRQLWYTLISNPSFVEKNLSNSINNKFTSSTYILCNRTILTGNNIIMDEMEIRDVMLEDNTDRREILLSLLNICSDNDPDYYSIGSVVNDNTVPHPKQICSLSLEIVGHCDGILCLTGNSHQNIVLCNPAIKEFTLLPGSCLLLPPKDLGDYDALESSVDAVGFGYDSKAKDYKVVRMVEFMSGTFTLHPTRVEVYTLSANSWREIETNINTWNVMWSPSKMYFKGTYYWLAYDYDMARKRKEAILSFDMAAELFHNVPIPDVFDDRYKSLAVLKESIVLLSYTAVDTGVPNKSFDIWMMDDFGSVNGSLTKHVTNFRCDCDCDG